MAELRTALGGAAAGAKTRLAELKEGKTPPGVHIEGRTRLDAVAKILQDGVAIERRSRQAATLPRLVVGRHRPQSERRLQ